MADLTDTQDIYVPKQPDGRGDIPKVPLFYMKSQKVSESVVRLMVSFLEPTVSHDYGDYRRLRRIQARVFSTTAVSRQEVHLQQYTSLFIDRLSELRNNSSSDVIDLWRWIHLLMADIASALTLGESFGSLEDGKLHPWLDTLTRSVKLLTFVRELSRYPGALRVLNACRPRSKKKEGHTFKVRAVINRTDTGTDRPDLMSHIIQAAGEGRMSEDEIEAVAMTFVIAGSETTAAMLTGSVYLLCKHPLVMQNLTTILRTQFRNASDMTLHALQTQEYLNAILQESLRLYPPAPGSLFRRTTAEGGIVMGEAAPPNASLTMNLWAANRSPLNFHKPEDMFPERWLKPRPVEFENDDRDVMKHFSVGPQDCPGKNFAWAEMRLLLAHMLWHFDFELSPESDSWIDGQKVFLFWEKPPLKVRMTAAA